MKIFGLWFCAVVLGVLPASAYAEQLTKLEALYVTRLNMWVKQGGDDQVIQDQVIKPCSMLTMATASLSEKTAFLASLNMDEYDFRASFCATAVINRVHPQPQFKNAGLVGKICKSQERLFYIVCNHLR